MIFLFGSRDHAEFQHISACLGQFCATFTFGYMCHFISWSQGMRNIVQFTLHLCQDISCGHVFNTNHCPSAKATNCLTFTNSEQSKALYDVLFNQRQRKRFKQIKQFVLLQGSTYPQCPKVVYKYVAFCFNEVMA